MGANGNGEWKLNVSAIITPLMAAAIGALVTWVMKIDERVFTLAATAASRADTIALERKMDAKFDLLVDKLEKIRKDLESDRWQRK